ncbi:MAG: hypothetical protein ACRDOK_29160, partial [Streptosporangiaceae bacterium]
DARGSVPAQVRREAPADQHPSASATVPAHSARARHASRWRAGRRQRHAIFGGAADPGERSGPAAAPDPARPAAPHDRPAREQLWSVEAVNAAGQLIASWRGVRLRDAGPLPRNAAWPPALLAAFLERSAADLGLDDGLRVTVSYRQPAVPAVAIPRQPGTGQSEPDNGDAPRMDGQTRPRRARPGPVSAPGAAQLAGFTFAVRAPVAAACAWVTVDEASRQHQPATGLAIAYGQLRAELTEPPPLLAGRLEAVRACLASAGLHAGTDLRMVQAASDDWVVLATRRARIACTVVELSGVAAPVAIALLTMRGSHARAAPARPVAAVVS